jgi:hypothetical protein
MKVRQLFSSPDFEKISAEHATDNTHREIGTVELPAFIPPYERELNDGLLFGRHNVGENLSKEPVIMDWLAKTQPDIEHVDVKWIRQPPGTSVPDHWDSDNFWRQYILPPDIDPHVKDVVRRLVFVTNWEPGQEWRFESNTYTGWTPGTCTEWEWWAKHGTANNSNKDRINIKLTGLRKNN